MSTILWLWGLLPNWAISAVGMVFLLIAGWIGGVRRTNAKRDVEAEKKKTEAVKKQVEMIQEGNRVGQDVRGMSDEELDREVRKWSKGS